MPWQKVMSEFEKGSLHSGKGGPVVTDPQQAVAIKMSMKRRAMQHEAAHSFKRRMKKKKGGK